MKNQIVLICIIALLAGASLIYGRLLWPYSYYLYSRIFSEQEIVFNGLEITLPNKWWKDENVGSERLMLARVPNSRSEESLFLVFQKQNTKDIQEILEKRGIPISLDDNHGIPLQFKRKSKLTNGENTFDVLWVYPKQGVTIMGAYYLEEQIKYADDVIANIKWKAD